MIRTLTFVATLYLTMHGEHLALGVDYARQCKSRKGNENWMRNLNENTRLEHIILPGTHHSGIIWKNTYKENLLNTWTARWAAPQGCPITEQLKMGVRFFDIRFGLDSGGRARASHGGSFVQNTLGERTSEIFSDIFHYLSRHPSELVVLKLRYEDYDQSKTTVMKKALNDLRIAYNTYLPRKNNRNNFGVDGQSLASDLGGSILVCKHGDLEINNGEFYEMVRSYKIYFVDCLGSWSKTKGSTNINDHYNKLITFSSNAAKSHQDKKKFIFLEAVFDVAAATKESLSSFDWKEWLTALNPNSGETIEDNARNVNNMIKSRLLRHPSINKKYPFPSNPQVPRRLNAIMTDFMLPGLADKIIDLNWESTKK